MISFKIDCFDLLVVQGTFQESSPAPQFEGINSLAFCLLYVPFLTTKHDHCKAIALTIQTFVCRVLSLLFNTLSRFVIAVLPRSNCLLISWLQSPSAVILEPKKRKLLLSFFYHGFYLFPFFIFFLSICHAVMGQYAMIQFFFF